MKRSDFAWVAVIASVWFTIFLLYERAYNGSAFAGFPVDDAWIHVVYAHNAAHGDWFVYSGTEHSSGDTSPLWVTALAGVYRMVGTSYEFLATRILSGIGYLCVGWGTAALVMRLARRRIYALLAATAVLSTGEFIWLAHSGMEATLFTALLLWGMNSLLADREHMSWRTGLLFGLAAAARPEGMLLFGITIVYTIVFLQGSDKEQSVLTAMFKRILQSVPAIVLFVLPLIPYAVYCYATTGYVFPNTFYAKSEPFTWTRVGASLLHFYGIAFAANPALFACSVAGGVVLLVNRYRSEHHRYVAGVLVVFPIITALSVHVNIGVRYMIPLFPLFVVLAFVGFELMSKRGWFGAAQAVAMTCIGLFVVTTNFFRHVPPQTGQRGYLGAAEYFARNVQNINDQQVRAGLWLAAHADVNDVIATNDIGAIAYFSNRRVIDMVGLTTNDLTRLNREYAVPASRDSALARYLARSARPRFIAYFEKWFASLDVLLPVDSTVLFILPFNTVSGADTMTVNRLDWSRTTFPRTP